MDEWIGEMLRRQIETGFGDLRGADASLTLPISERLLNDILSRVLPPSAPIRDPHVCPEAGDRFQVRARLWTSTFLPPIRLRVIIDRQPEFPSSAVLVLRLERAAIMSLAGPFLRFMNALPDGVVVRDDRIRVDLRALLDRKGLAQYLDYVKELRINTVEGAVVLTVRGHVS